MIYTRTTEIERGRLDGDDGAEWISRTGESSIVLSDLLPVEAGYSVIGRFKITVEFEPCVARDSGPESE